MIGVLITFVSGIFREVGTSIGKHEFDKSHEDVFSMGFINALVGTIFFIGAAIVTDTFILSPASYPTLIIRIILELLLTYITLTAIVKATRSSFGFLRVLTLPLLLAVDFIIGYTLSIYQVLGIGIILITILKLYQNSVVDKKGNALVVSSAILAVATISLYKYNITNFNSVAAEETVVMFAKLLFVTISAFWIKKHNPFKVLLQPLHILQAVTSGISGLLVSYAFLFAPASVIMSAKRTTTILFSSLSGHFYFHERKLKEKLFYLSFISLGIILLMF